MRDTNPEYLSLPQGSDVLNNTFTIDGLEYFPGSKIVIYNRWGNKVFESDDYDNSWSPDVSDGVYYYVLNVALRNGEFDNYSGDVTIVTEQ